MSRRISEIHFRDKNALGVIAITDENPIYPTVDRACRLKFDNDPELAKEAEEVMLDGEQRRDYDAQRFAQKHARLGVVQIYSAQDY